MCGDEGDKIAFVELHEANPEYSEVDRVRVYREVFAKPSAQELPSVQTGVAFSSDRSKDVVVSIRSCMLMETFSGKF